MLAQASPPRRFLIMSVIECSCGMIMSLPAVDPRRCCIRCGGIEFRVIENGDTVQQRSDHFGSESTATSCAQSTTFDLAALGRPVGAAPNSVRAHV